MRHRIYRGVARPDDDDIFAERHRFPIARFDVLNKLEGVVHAVQLFAEGRLRVEGRRVFIADAKPAGTALVNPS